MPSFFHALAISAEQRAAAIRRPRYELALVAAALARAREVGPLSTTRNEYASARSAP